MPGRKKERPFPKIPLDPKKSKRFWGIAPLFSVIPAIEPLGSDVVVEVIRLSEPPSDLQRASPSEPLYRYACIVTISVDDVTVSGQPVVMLENAIIIKTAIITKLNKNDFSSPFTSFSFIAA